MNLRLRTRYIEDAHLQQYQRNRKGACYNGAGVFERRDDWDRVIFYTQAPQYPFSSKTNCAVF